MSNTLCQAPVRDETTLVISIAMAGCGIAVVAFILRMVSRAVGPGDFWKNSGMDDVLMGVALILVVAISGCSVIRKL